MLNLFKRKNINKVLKKDLINKIDLHGEVPITEIIDKAQYLYDVLELENLDCHFDTDHQRGIPIEKHFLSSRQNVTMEHSILSAVDGNIHNAFHELVNFIHNYGMGINEPISNFERFCIKKMLVCIFNLYNRTDPNN
ncbi:hypothetical protein [Lederbergia lenta]|uniref:hypothetical protein n=1 Tax=Lederbergia lenta TaxID=1467 RepID=UPI00203EE604|nr:hypothetical protein [Lederbergia lenta]MCM3113633.1 hypothetical protein [Lederbergia lenta]